MPVVLTDTTANNKTVVLWRNALESSVVSAQGDQVDNPAINAMNDSTFDYWGNAGSGSTFLGKSGGGGNLAANALGISGHNLAATGGRIYLRRSSDNINFTNVITPYAPITNEDVFFIFPLESNLYWRILFDGAGSYVSNVKLGARLDFPYTPIEGYKPAHHSRKYKKYFNNSIEGHLLGNRVMAAGGTTTVEFPDVARDFADGPLLGFKDHYDRGRSFFYAGWPNGKPQDVAYAWADGEDASVDVSYTHGSKRASVGFGMSMKYGR